MNLTKHFTLEELVRSSLAARKGLSNTPPPAVVANLHTLAEKLEEVRIILGRPLIVTSGYRGVTLNRLLGSQDTSAHVQGLAADFICPMFGSPLEVAEELVSAGLQFDQLIHEFGGWVHLGLRAKGAVWRQELLTISTAGTKLGLHRV